MQTPAHRSEAMVAEIEALHRRCGVYTRPEIVKTILDEIGWRPEEDLSTGRLLDPAAGDGSFLIEAARRLVTSFVRRSAEMSAQTLAGRILSFELHAGEAQRARQRLAGLLRDQGLHYRTVEACVRSWILNQDFLLAALPTAGFTHVVGNPPYIRWSKIPPTLRKHYEQVLPANMIRGDLFLPFLDRALASLQKRGKCGFLCSDRWKFMAFAEGFRQKWLPLLDVRSERRLNAADAFTRNVNSYPMILTASRKQQTKGATVGLVTEGRCLLNELGCIVRVGPALGYTPAYVLEPHEQDVEQALLQPWVSAPEILEGAIGWRGRRVIAMYKPDGKLIDIEEFPRLKSRLLRFRKNLEKRSIVANGARWFRPIDKIDPILWTRPKLLIPELAKVPRVAIDRSGAVPSHAVYAIFAPDDNIDALYEKLRDGKLAAALRGIAPMVKGGYVRCYRRFLLQMRL